MFTQAVSYTHLADAIYREEVDKAVEEYTKANGKTPSWMPNQYFAALTLSLIHI